MRTLVDIPDKQIEELGAICEARHISRAEAVRKAITAYIERHREAPGQAFGLWQHSSNHPAAEDGLEYQERVRSEW